MKLYYKIISIIPIFVILTTFSLQAKVVKLTCDPMEGNQLIAVNGKNTSKPEMLTNKSTINIDLPNNVIIFNNDTYKIVNASNNLVSGVFTTENSTSVVSIRLKTLAVSFSHHVARANEDYVLSVQGKCVN
ncbi:hypothetical protein HAV_00863 [Candidatus Hepatincola sp. Av]